MRDLVERLSKVQEDTVDLLSLVKCPGKVIDCKDKLSLTRPQLAEAMLEVGENVVVRQGAA